MNYQTIIGIEIHVELNTKTKMFCRCSAEYFGKEPNTHTCPVCLGLPGATPYINKEALRKCMMIGLALNCQVNENSRFERKNYFYPDLSKGYQISQYRWPLCIGGKLEVGGREIRINRVHQEEDTGKLMHMGGGALGVGDSSTTHEPRATSIDFNRSGVPLVEIVTEPDFDSSDSVVEYAKMIQQLFKTLGVSSADMEKGDMRLEANVSVKSEGESGLPNYRVELKNINSFRFMKAAIEFEIKRQIEALEKGEILTQETRGWDEDKKQTYLQRSKEEAHDYRYFPDPDLGELKIKSEEVKVKEAMPELPWEAPKRLSDQYQIPLNSAVTIVNMGTTQLFESAANLGQEQGVDLKSLANYFINTKDLNIDPNQIVEAIKSKTTGIISDEVAIEQYCNQAIEENPKAVQDFKSGKVNVIMVLFGVVMKKSQGKADPAKVQEILERLLA